MRTLAVVVADPIRNLRAGLIEAEEQGFVEQLVAHPAIEAFTEAVLRRFSRRNEMLGDLVVLRPSQHVVAGELGAAVRDDHGRLAAAFCADDNLKKISVVSAVRLDLLILHQSIV
jgi:hypothetical protein